MSGLRWDQKEWRRLLRYVRRASRNHHNAEDLLQTAFVRLSEYGRLTEVKNPAAFLTRTARNLAADEARHDKVRNELGDGIEVLSEISDEAPLQTEALASRERLRRVAIGLERLPPRTREVFLMHRLDGLRYSDIARQFGISESAVEKHVAKASLFLTAWVEGW